MNVIPSRVKNMNDKEKLCIISFDEMSLKSHLDYASNKDELIGLEDYGDGEKNKLFGNICNSFYGMGHL